MAFVSMRTNEGIAARIDSALPRSLEFLNLDQSLYDEAEHKREVKAELTRRGLGSFMNDMKWQALIGEINKLPFPPPYQRKDVMRAEPEPGTFDSDVWYLGDWAEGVHPLFSIEWIRIRPRHLKRVGRLLPEAVVDCGAAFEQALQALGQHYEKRDESIWIYGYR